MNIPWWQPQTGSQEKKLIGKVLKSNFLNDGEYTTRFEEKVAELLGCKYAIAVTSGTAAMFLALKALGVGRDDEVIVPDMTFIATANAVEMCGAKPVLTDIDPNTLTIDPKAVEDAITKKTKVIMPVHVSGRAADMESILKIAGKYQLDVVEDAAEAFMSKRSGKYLGTFGIMGCLSFSPPKIITTGQGGMVITNNKRLARLVRELKDQGRFARGTGGDDIHGSVGYNFKLTNLQSAIGLGQLSFLEKRIKKIRRINYLYRRHLQNVDGIRIFDVDLRVGELPLWTDALVEKRDGLDKYLRLKGIDCRRFWFPVHSQKPYKLPDKNFPRSSGLSSKALWLPSAFTLKDSDVKRVCKEIKKFFSHENNN